MFEREDDLRGLPRLRWRVDEDQSVIATACRKRYRGDHLYWHGPGKLGIYYAAGTRNAATYRLRWYRRFLGGRILREQSGDFDGLVIFRAEGPEAIPGIFFRSRPRNPDGKGGFSPRSHSLGAEFRPDLAVLGGGHGGW